jgi:CYTH domain-containing protein
MADEIERRFLVADDFKPEDHNASKAVISQSYIDNTGEWVIRVRKYDESFDGAKYFVTMKKFVTNSKNIEHEFEINEEEYLDLMQSCVSTVEKTRYYILVKDWLWEVDVFSDVSVEPRIIAELELFSENEDIVLPPWITKEVTGDRWYSNQQIAERIVRRRALSE